MAIRQTKQGSSQGFGSFGDTAGFQGFGKPGLSSVDQLLELARLQGGAVAQAAEEIVHPKTSILSRAGDLLKKSFNTFVEVVSVPGQAVAGALSSDLTVRDAIRDNVNVSDVIFGDEDPDASIYKKVGSFVVRTGVDILTDPLTYITFGTAKGIFGLRGATEIALGERAAAKVGREALSKRAVSEEGQEVFKYLTAVENQSKGLTKALTYKGKIDETFDLAKKELDDLLKESIDAPLDISYARRAMTNLLEKRPDLADILIDKGGIKFFGKSILSGQRVSSAAKLLPGMTLVDNITLPVRRAIQARFDPSLVKVDKEWVRLPAEYIELVQAKTDLTNKLVQERMTRLKDIAIANDLDINEINILRSAIETQTMPADARIANAWKQALAFTDDEFTFLRRYGIPVSKVEGHVPHVLVKNKIQASKIPFVKSMIDPNKTPAALHAEIAKFVDVKTGKAQVGTAERLGLKETDELGILEDKYGNLYKEARATIDEIKANGFDGFEENPLVAYAIRSMDNVKAAVTKNFLEQVSKTYGVLKSEARPGFVELTGFKGKLAEKVLSNADDVVKTNMLTAVAGEGGEQILFHPAIAKHIDEFVAGALSDDIDGVLKSYDRIQNFFKSSVTSIFPAFHGRNAISNVFLNYLDLGLQALNPRTHSVSANLIFLDRKANSLATKAAALGGEKAREELAEIMTRKVFTDASGYDWSFGELRNILKEKNVAFNRNLLGALDLEAESPLSGLFIKPTGKAKTKDIIEKISPIPLTGDLKATTEKFVPFKYGREIGRAVEEHARLVNFISNLQKTGDVSLAAQRTKQFLFDYQNLTNFEKAFMRRLVPFYSFTRKNLELQMKTLLRDPGRVSAQVHAFDSLGDVIAGNAKLTEEEKDALPDWIKTGINLLSSRKGQTVEVLGSLGTPLEQPFQAFQPNVLLGSISPVLRLPLEQLSGYSFFHGKALSDVTNAAAFKKAPNIFKKMIGYYEVEGTRKDGSKYEWSVSMRPEVMNLFLNLPPSSRVLSALKQIQTADVSEQGRIMQQLIGVRPFAFDLEREALKRELELKKRLEKILLDAGTIRKFERAYLPQ